MRLYRLNIQNFRQFRSGSISFATGEDANVTVMHGQNGSGKTTLKNALTWVLYEKVDFELRPTKLASQGALAEVDVGETIQVEVSLEFEHEETDYELIRWAEYQKQSANDFEGQIVDEGLSLSYDNPDGSRGSRNNPQDAIKQILPDRLSDLFFFDGEYINRLSETRSQDEIREAIQNIMGLTIIERSIRHLESVEDRFENELEASANTELREYIERRQELKTTREDREQALEAADETKSTLKAEIQDIKSKLERIDDSADLEGDRRELEADLEDFEQQVENTNDEIEETISKQGLLPFAMPAVEATAKGLDRLREEGTLPSEVSNQFIDGLLEEGECICGRPLEPGTEHYREVEALKSDAVADGFDQAAMRIISHLTDLGSEQEAYFDTIEELLQRRSDLRDEEQAIAEELSEISAQLERLDTIDPKTGETPAELESARDVKAEKLESIKKEIVRHEVNLEELDEDLADINGKIDEAREDAKEAKLARKRMRAAESVRRQLKASFDDLQSRVRTWSNKLVEETFDEIATKEYKAEITDEFELRIKDQLQDEYLEVEKSRGERQIASLTFIGSLVNIARERYESSGDSEYFSGGIYPLVMDSPFGALDDTHRREVSRVIPTLAEQVVVLVTDSQWRGPVANELGDLSAEQYNLIFDDGDESGTYPQTTIERESQPQEAK
jgi:DNA sulfur modification protein DndD